MSPLEEALTTTNARIAVLLAQDQPVLDPLFDAFAQVTPFLPCADPSPEQRAALRSYRQNLEALQAAIPELTVRLRSKRTSVLAKLNGLKAARAYQDCVQF